MRSVARVLFNRSTFYPNFRSNFFNNTIPFPNYTCFSPLSLRLANPFFSNNLYTLHSRNAGTLFPSKNSFILPSLFPMQNLFTLQRRSVLTLCDEMNYRSYKYYLLNKDRWIGYLKNKNFIKIGDELELTFTQVLLFRIFAKKLLVVSGEEQNKLLEIIKENTILNRKNIILSSAFPQFYDALSNLMATHKEEEIKKILETCLQHAPNQEFLLEMLAIFNLHYTLTLLKNIKQEEYEFKKQEKNTGIFENCLTFGLELEYSASSIKNFRKHSDDIRSRKITIGFDDTIKGDFLGAVEGRSAIIANQAGMRSFLASLQNLLTVVNDSCGFHVHIGDFISTSPDSNAKGKISIAHNIQQELEKLDIKIDISVLEMLIIKTFFINYLQFEPFFDGILREGAVVGGEETHNKSYTDRALENKTKGIEPLIEEIKKIQNIFGLAYLIGREPRNSNINFLPLTGVSTGSTIEVRQHEGTNNENHIIAWVNFLYRVMNISIEQVKNLIIENSVSLLKEVNQLSYNMTDEQKRQRNFQLQSNLSKDIQPICEDKIFFLLRSFLFERNYDIKAIKKELEEEIKYGDGGKFNKDRIQTLEIFLKQICYPEIDMLRELAKPIEEFVSLLFQKTSQQLKEMQMWGEKYLALPCVLKPVFYNNLIANMAAIDLHLVASKAAEENDRVSTPLPFPAKSTVIQSTL